MNKIAQYLNEHILGEATSSKSIREKFSRDGSILSILPELVVHPRVTNDIRKVARFTWQLAEKGHVMPITVRGGGSDQTGAAIGSGIIINTAAHLNNIIYLNLKGKDQFIHVQPGANFGVINEVLKSHGMIIPSFPTSFAYSTIGGAIANNSGGVLSGRFGPTGNWVNRLELILANGDLIETKRINRHELSKKKGLQTFEGELYRKIDGLIDDNQQLINDKISRLSDDNTGYSGIAKVKGSDGSFDLTPLIVGSQGTLGIVSEIIMKLNYYSDNESIIVAVFNKSEVARDAADAITTLKPGSLDIIDGQLFEKAQTDYGKKFMFSSVDSDLSNSAILFASFNDISDNARHRKIKHTLKKLSKFDTKIFTDQDYSTDEIHAIRSVSSLTLQPETDDESMPPLIDGASIPAMRREEFIAALDELADKHHIELPLYIKWLDGVIHTRPSLQLHQVSDKQKAFKLINDYAELVSKFDGNFSAESAEGRIKATATYAQMDDDILILYSQIRTAFDPYGTLNPGVKQKSDLKTLVSSLNPNYSLADFAEYSPRI
jgi:FAD/FMN-containing dehydrogenase